MKLRHCLLLLGMFQAGLSVPLEEDVDTLSIDATTLTPIVDETVSPAGPVEVAVNTTEGEDPLVKTGQTIECTTSRGKKGQCMRVSDCFTLLIPETGFAVRNRVLAEMVVEAAGFCDGSLQARSDFTPSLMDQVLRSEVLLCCPQMEEVPPESFKPEEPDMDSNVYDEMFKGKNCGYVGGEKNVSATTPTTTTTTTTTTTEATTTTTATVITVESPSSTTSDTPAEDVTAEPPRIVKGRKTRPGEFPWVVALMNRGRQFCGGSLINQNTVLTAAHCVQHMTPSDVKNLRLLIGDHDIKNKNEVKHEVRGARAVKYHKGFSMRHLQHDIALLILDKPVSYSPTIQATCLHSGEPNPADGTTLSDVAGWGALSEGGGQPSDLRAVTVRVLTKEECVKRYSKTRNKIGDGMVCAGADKGEDSCQGDSGGPLTIDSKTQAKQIGIVSWGIGCGRYPGVYTRVDRYLKWINTNMVKDMGYE